MSVWQYRRIPHLATHHTHSLGGKVMMCKGTEANPRSQTCMQERREDPLEQDNRSYEGAGDADRSAPATADGGPAGAGVTTEEGGIDQINEATTADGGIAVDGGKLAGNKDDFDDELNERRNRNTPGADPENEVQPPNDRDLRQ